MESAILGISAFYHDSAAALLVDGQLAAAAQEERFSRTKHDASFPAQAIRYALQEAGLRYEELTAVAFYEKPFIKFERLLETYHAFAPHGLPSFLKAMPVWIQEKLLFKRMLRQHLHTLGKKEVSLFFPEHHLSHAASAFYPSPFEEAAILTLDGVGEWATTTIGHGRGQQISLLQELHFPHSLGLLYSAFTFYLGFEVNEGEYKVMGLSAYGDPDSAETQTFQQKITDEMVDIREDGSLLLNMAYFRFATRLQMTHDPAWQQLLQLERRPPEAPLLPSHMNLALAIQQVTEKIVMRLARTARQLTGSPRLVMAGGVALNSVVNGKLLEAGIFEQLWIQPAAGDAGGAVGAAYAVWHISQNQPRQLTLPDAMQGMYLGPDFTNRQVAALARKYSTPHTVYADEDALVEAVAELLADGKVIGWFQGRMEFGPRALGNRSILGDPRDPEMQQKINRQIKFRESFRPFAPSVLAEDALDFFDLPVASPYMLLVRPTKSNRQRFSAHNNPPSLQERRQQVRSDIPAVTHVDYSARIQTVHRQTNPRYWKLIQAFKKLTGYGVLVNTSFNVRGEPIVCTPEDAYQCFQSTAMDYLVIEDFLFHKSS